MHKDWPYNIEIEVENTKKIPTRYQCEISNCPRDGRYSCTINDNYWVLCDEHYDTIDDWYYEHLQANYEAEQDRKYKMMAEERI